MVCGFFFCGFLFVGLVRVFLSNVFYRLPTADVGGKFNLNYMKNSFEAFLTSVNCNAGISRNAGTEQIPH